MREFHAKVVRVHGAISSLAAVANCGPRPSEQDLQKLMSEFDTGPDWADWAGIWSLRAHFPVLSTTQVSQPGLALGGSKLQPNISLPPSCQDMGVSLLQGAGWLVVFKETHRKTHHFWAPPEQDLRTKI